MLPNASFWMRLRRANMSSRPIRPCWRYMEKKFSPRPPAQGVDLGFEASVGGGIPVIQALREGLAANTIQSIYGIINGTSNYILSRMTHEGQRFETVLEDAQASRVCRGGSDF